MLKTVYFRSSIFWLLVLLSCKQESSVPYYNSPDFEPHFLSQKDASRQIPHTIAPFSFTDQNKKTITDQSVNQKIHIASFIFTSCGSICPVMIKNLKIVSSKYQKSEDVVLLSFSVTPWIDTPQKLKDFKVKNNITNPNWHFLTGNKTEIYKLARQSYFAEEDLGFTSDSTKFLHTEHIILADRDKKIRGIYNGTLQTDIEQLIKDTEVLRKE
ncbi:SCO family protein [Chryseobacterium wangxinyae]|uniref:SCO family protein n=1 Tax=Chryseobacterium sp. CY350 TaxID=2997336 RepID=UPI00226FCA86|nr:SCO family protein [Chryseobacterium sp. CY350]MCY0977381.1 SCO family protein [Chryseobacterium sp. CY350]WBZ95600.1 SCO family protein [Chryseobacterium sp. CY350]